MTAAILNMSGGEEIGGEEEERRNNWHREGKTVLRSAAAGTRLLERVKLLLFFPWLRDCSEFALAEEGMMVKKPVHFVINLILQGLILLWVLEYLMAKFL